MMRRFLLPGVLILPFCALFCACRSYHVDITVENRTGTPIQLLEVDYPNASFGVDALASDAIYHYRVQIQGTGPVKVQYVLPAGMQPQISGPTLVQHQQGSLRIVLLPNGKAQFLP